MRITKIEFTEQHDVQYALRLNGGRWDLFEGAQLVGTYLINEDNYRAITIEIFEKIFGFVGTYGDMQPYLIILQQLTKLR